MTKIEPIRNRSISLLEIIARYPKNAPMASEPLSPIKISAGWQLYHKNPIKAPMSALAMIATSPTLKLGKSKYELILAFPIA